MNKPFPIWPTLLLSALLLASGWQVSGAQSRLVLQPESRLWIEGTTTLNAFTCHSQAVAGYGVLESDTALGRPTSAAPEAAAARAAVAVRVETFDCGKRQMNRDLHSALQAAAYPEIRFELEHAEVLATPDERQDEYELRVTGRLTIAGTTRPITMAVQGRPLADGRYRVQGSHPLLMTDFGIEPPIALLGLIQARNRIVVRFDFVAAPLLRPSTTTTTQSTQ